MDAHKRRMHADALLDKDNRTDKHSAADFLANQGVSTKLDAACAFAHNEIIIDGESVNTGSFNFTLATQEKNEENVLIMRGQGGMVWDPFAVSWGGSHWCC